MYITDIDKAYVAGFMDGEGFISISINGNSHIGFVNTNIDVLKYIQEMYSGTIREKPNGNENWKPAYELYMYDINKVKCILESILPYLKIKKKQALLMLYYINERTINKKLTNEELEFREKYYLEMKELNRRGI